jgi:hypothetical protein
MIHQETDAEMRARWARENKELRALLAKQRAERLAEKAAKVNTPNAVEAAEKAAATAAELAAKAAEAATSPPPVNKNMKPVVRGDGRRFESLTEVKRMYGPDADKPVIDCCNGLRRKIFGHTWKWERPNG